MEMEINALDQLDLSEIKMVKQLSGNKFHETESR